MYKTKRISRASQALAAQAALWPSQTAFAKRLKVSVSRLNNWINGRARPDLDTILELDRDFGIRAPWWAEFAEESAAKTGTEG